jgi:transposase-like protein
MSVFTIADRDEIVRRYMRGDRVRDIAKAFGCDHSYPGKLASRSGIEKCRRNLERQGKAEMHRHRAASAEMGFGV